MAMNSDDMENDNGFPHELPAFVQKHRPNRLVITLYAESRGYSLSIRIEDLVSENVIMECSYNDIEILNHIHKGELIPFIQDEFRKFPHNLFYYNCIIGEIRDCRDSDTYEPKYILLKPTSLTGFQNGEMCGRKKIKLSREVENCKFTTVFDPSMHFSSREYQNFGCWPDRRQFCESSHLKRKSEAISNERKGVSVAFLKNDAEQKSSRKINHIIDVKTKYASRPLWSVSSSDNVSKTVDSYWKYYVHNVFQKSCALELLPKDYLKNENAVQSAEVTIMKVPGEEQYYGKLSIKSPLERDSSSSQFLLGSKMRVDKFIKKYTDVFTVEDTKPVKKQDSENGMTTTTYTKAVKKSFHKRSTLDGMPTKEISQLSYEKGKSFNISEIFSKSGFSQGASDINGSHSIFDTSKLLQSLSSSN